VKKGGRGGWTFRKNRKGKGVKTCEEREHQKTALKGVKGQDEYMSPETQRCKFKRRRGGGKPEKGGGPMVHGSPSGEIIEGD